MNKEEILQILCNICKNNQYVRVNIDVEGIKLKVFFKNPKIIYESDINSFAIISDNIIEIYTLRKKTKLNKWYNEYNIQYKNYGSVILDKEIRIYKTPYSIKAVKRIIENIFNNKLK